METVHILTTGGTICNTKEGRISANEVIRKVKIPDIKILPNFQITEILRTGSKNINPDNWLTIGKLISDLIKRKDTKGIIITHGSNTLEETAYFLNLVITDKKPIILTGAQRWDDELSPDGPRNLADSIRVCLNDEVYGKGVLVVINERIHAARDVRKTGRWLDGFTSGNIGILGEIDVDEHTNFAKVSFYRSPICKHTFLSDFEIAKIKELPRVDIIYTYAGCDATLVKSALDSGAKGLVVAAFPTGSVPQAMQDELDKAIKNGIPIIRCNRGLGGEPESDIEMGTQSISGSNMSPQKARILLMVSLGCAFPVEKIRNIFKEY